MTTLTPDETALDIFQRFSSIFFDVRITGTKVEEISLHSNVEVLASPSEVSEFVLSAALDFSQQFEDGYILHVSTGNNWFISMQQSGIDLESTALKQLHDEGRVRCFTAGHLLDVFHVAEYLQASMKANDKVLLLLEGISPLLQAQKTMLGTLNKPSLVESTLDSLSLLTKFHAVACFWVNSVSRSSQAYSLREAHPKDPLGVLWRRKVPRVLYYQPANHTVPQSD